jgi:hypothetical protein
MALFVPVLILLNGWRRRKEVIKDCDVVGCHSSKTLPARPAVNRMEIKTAGKKTSNKKIMGKQIRSGITLDPLSCISSNTRWLYVYLNLCKYITS